MSGGSAVGVSAPMSDLAPGRVYFALIRPTLPRGRSTLRTAMSVNQSGSGYLAGFSRTITVPRP